MDSSQVELYDRSREISQMAFRSACYAPFTSLYFDTAGDVRACCHNNTYLLGNISDQTIEEIWRGGRASALRDALKDYSFDLGCGFCAKQVEGSYPNSSPLRWDRFRLSSTELDWPQQFEFSITNTCNLECIMCGGLWSSAIRARRERLPPLPMPYHDRFFQQLEVFLPHLKRLRFLGGEPFLSEAYYRIWGRMIEGGYRVPCHVTTNGTQYNARVERVLEHLDVGIAISMDGYTRETVESIRVNAKYDILLENCRRFHNYAKSRQTAFGLTYCFMRQNWHEFGDFCRRADVWDVLVTVNTVNRPVDCSLYTLPVQELANVVCAMEAQAPSMEGLKKNHRVWFGELNRLRGCLAAKPASAFVVL